MKAFYFSDFNKVELREVGKPTIVNDTDVIVKVSLTSLCGSDVHIVKGAIPSEPGFILGHEYVGVIEQVGNSVKNFKPNDRVIGPPAPFCRVCENCLNGNFSHCINGSSLNVHGSKNLDGVHAEYVRVPFADMCLKHVPDNIDDEEAVMVFDILSTSYSAVKRAKIKPGDNVVIMGAGPVGLSAILTSKLYSPNKIILVSRKDLFRMNKAKEIGATHIINASKSDVLDEIYKITEGKGADVVIDASGSEIAIQQAVECAGIGARVSLIGIGGDILFPLSEVFFKNLNITMGLGDLTLASDILNLISSKKIDIKPLITHRVRLDEIEKAYNIFDKRTEDVIKILIRP